MTERTLSALLETADPAWPGLSQAIERARNPTRILAPDATAHDDLLKLQVTTHSTLGALVVHTGGLLVDHGWVRMLGSHSARMGRSLVQWNESIGAAGACLIGDDVLGGLFAINGVSSVASQGMFTISHLTPCAGKISAVVTAPLSSFFSRAASAHSTPTIDGKAGKQR